MESPILFVNACVRKDSRTRKLAEKLLERLDGPSEEICLEDIAFPRADEEFLKLRDQLLARGDLQHPLFDLARQFAQASAVVIAAPYWDLSFPAMLKQYLEQINVVGVTFRYSPDGVPVSLCNASRLYYVTTAGGCFVPEEFGFGYVKALAQNFYGIQDVRCILASGLDIDGADEAAILRAAEEDVSGMDLT